MTMISNNPEYLFVKQAAERLGYTVEYTRELIRRGKLPGFKAGVHLVVKTEDVENYNKPESMDVVPVTPKAVR